MSADIEKLAVFDDRIVQTRPKYAVEKGALSLTNSPFSAISQTQSQHTYNIYVPSENVYVARDVDWSSTFFLRLDVQCYDTAGQFPVGQTLFEWGVDGSLAALPLNSLCATITATINDTTVTINSQDVLTEVLRLTDYKQTRLQRTCPTMLDKYQQNADALGATNDPISGYTNMSHDYHEVPNGAYYNVAFTNPDGSVIPSTLTGQAYTFNGTIVNVVDGIPVSTIQDETNRVNATYSVFLKIRTTEKIVLSPFIFAEQYAADTGLFGINNIQFVMNLRDPSRCMRLRNSYTETSVKEYYSGQLGEYSTYSSPLSYNTNVGGGVFRDSIVNVQFLTPSLDIPLPPKSVVPYMEFPRFITQPQNSTLGAFGSNTDTQQLQSQTITLPQIPDLLIIYCKALADPANLSTDKTLDPTLPQFGASYLPIEVSTDGVRTTQPLSINFDNFSGLLSSQTAEQLYHMSIRNGLDMDWNTWAGYGRVSTGVGGKKVPTVGGFLVLKPSVDLTLQSGQAPSLVGNFTLQFNIRVKNTFPFSVTPQLFVVTANSGFFESIRGSSRIIKGVLSEQDIISAPLSPAGTRAGLARLIGGKVAQFANRMGLIKGQSDHSSHSSHGHSAAAAQSHKGKGISSRLM